MQRWTMRGISCLAVLALSPAARSQQPAPTPDPVRQATPDLATQAPPDLAKQPTLYVVGYAHLDTEWRWCYPQTIREFIPATLFNNFPLIDKYPNYVFNFTGSRRYQMMREYYPEGYEKLKKYVADGRWFPCGSSVDENDANVPSAESLVRQVLYGNRYFRQEFGKASEEYMLPDCFGFPAALPSVLAHCGIKGFSTQKLTWGLAIGEIPFKVGVWEGPDGRGVMAAFDPGAYVGEVMENLATSDGWKTRIDANGKKSGVFTDYHYYGTGDQGGAPTERSVKMVDKSVDTKGPLTIISGPADWMFKAITPAMQKNLPRYKGELLLTEHSSGSITSEGYMKRWNRKNELLADTAERASVVAWWMGGRAYPSQKLEDAWYLVLGSQMHDILPGTSHPTAYDYAWNDELLAANQFGAVLEDAASVVAGAMDTRGDGTSLVVFNPLSVARDDVVEVEVPGDVAAMKGVDVTGADGRPVPSQVIDGGATTVRVAFLAKAPSVGFAAYNVRLTPSVAGGASTLKVEDQRLENARYVVKLNADGDVASIFDKKASRELLAAPARLELHHENPKNWPAWNQDWADRQLPVKEYVGGPAKFRVVERGPARVAVEVVRTLGSSTFTQVIRLCAGDAGDRVEFDNTIDWAQRERSLRAAFPLSVSNPIATYDIQTGTLQRPNNAPKRFEAPSHQWFDLTDAKGDYGVTVMNDCKFGSDKPDDHTLRLTLLHTPGTRGGYQDQGTQDLGRHHVLHALSGHAGDWRDGRSAVQAARLNQPIVAFRATPHDGPLGKSFSMLHVSDDRVRVSAVKKAEDGDEVILRLRELHGTDARDVRVTLARPIVSAREVDGQERSMGAATVRDGNLVAHVGGYELRAFAVKLGDAPAKASKPVSAPLDLAMDADVASRNGNRGDGAMDAKGGAYPAEQFPATIAAEEATFTLGSTADGSKNALICRGQEMSLPKGDFNRLCLAWASSDGDVATQLQVDGKPVAVRVPSWTGYVGQWDRRLWLGDVPELTFGWSNELGGIEPGWVKPDPVVWFCSHHHTKSGDAYYKYCYLFKSVIDLPKGATTIRLPDDERIKLFAATAVASGCDRVVAAAPLSDTLDDRVQDAPRITPNGGVFSDAVTVRIEPRLYWRVGAIRYTLDGAEPTANSLAYAGPFVLSRSATIKSAIVDGQGRLGPVTSAKIEVNDVTPPTIKEFAATYKSSRVRIEFSEPVDEAAAIAENYRFDPPLAVTAATKNATGQTVTLELAVAPELDRTYHLKISGIKDASDARNAMKPVALELRVRGPVYKNSEISRKEYGKEIRDLPGLPVKAKDAWTLNMFVRAEKQPENRTVIAGFGKCAQSGGGEARYMAKFGTGVQFWSHHADVESKTPLDLGRWQMLTATYDGHALRLYKNAAKIGERDVELADDENVVHFAPLDPWDGKRRFDGDIREFTIWNTALTDEAIRSLRDTTSMPSR